MQVEQEADSCFHGATDSRAGAEKMEFTLCCLKARLFCHVFTVELAIAISLAFIHEFFILKSWILSYQMSEYVSHGCMLASSELCKAV